MSMRVALGVPVHASYDKLFGEIDIRVGNHPCLSLPHKPLEGGLCAPTDRTPREGRIEHRYRD